MSLEIRLSVAAVCVAVVAGIAACSEDGKKTEPVLRPVRAEQVFASGAERSRTFSGVARAGTESKISFKVKGTVDRVFVKVGDAVGVGTVIAELDPTDYRLQVEDARASLNQAKAQQRNASTEYERVRGLYESRSASKQGLDAARTAFESASAAVESIEKRLELAERQLGYTRLAAPIAGSIASVEVEDNENVQVGQTVCLLTSGANIEVEVAIPEVLIAQISEGDAVQVTFDAFPDRRLGGRVSEVGVASTGLATTFPVTVRLDAGGGDVRSGMTAEVTFAFHSGGGKERYVVRPFAVGEDRNGRYVWVVGPSDSTGVGVVHRRDVTIGVIDDDGIEILDGLEDGDYVVTAGVSKLSDGQRVRFNPGGTD